MEIWTHLDRDLPAIQLWSSWWAHPQERRPGPEVLSCWTGRLPRDPSDYSPVWSVIPPQSIVGSPSWWSGRCASSPDQLSCPALLSIPVLCEFNFRKCIHYIQVFYRSKQIVSGICLCRGGVKCVAMWLWLLCNINGHFILAYMCTLYAFTKL